jgi:hypothetical protein
MESEPRASDQPTIEELLAIQRNAAHAGDQAALDEANAQITAMLDEMRSDEETQPEGLIADPNFFEALDVQQDLFQRPASSARDAALGAVNEVILRLQHEHDNSPRP